MLFIDKNLPDFLFAKEEHHKHTKCLIKKRLGANCLDPNCIVCNSRLEATSNVTHKIRELLLEDDFLKAIISGDPSELLFFNELFFRSVLGNDIFNFIQIALSKNKNTRSQEDAFFVRHYRSLNNTISKIFDYDGWFVQNEPSSYYSAYHMATYLNIRSCVYCNRSYTITQVEKDEDGKISKLTRPQFDHWFPQEKYPLLALSFYNLIPSCSICNSSVKGRINFDVANYLHPYEDNVSEYILFSYNYRQAIDNAQVEVTAINDDELLENRINNTLRDFHIEDMYNGHQPELKDLLKIKQSYSESYLKSLKDAFPDANLTDEETYRLVFGVEVNPKDFHKRPLSKFKHDILKELGII